MPAIDATALAAAARRRGISLTGLAGEAGISRNTMTRIRRGLPVRANVARRLDEALGRFPELSRVALLDR